MSEEKKCKHCAMMIPKEAKICPHCRKQQGTSAAVGCLAIIIIVFVTVSIFVMIGQENAKESTYKSIENAKITPLSKAAEKIKKVHPNWSNNVCILISKKEIVVGMNKEQVIAAWGKPHKINSTIRAQGTSEQWVMSDSVNTDYLYFDNDILKTMQQTK